MWRPDDHDVDAWKELFSIPPRPAVRPISLHYHSSIGAKKFIHEKQRKFEWERLSAIERYSETPLSQLIDKEEDVTRLWRRFLALYLDAPSFHKMDKVQARELVAKAEDFTRPYTPRVWKK